MRKGTHHTKKTRKKISVGHVGMTGKSHSKLTKKKIGLANKGRIVSKETRKKLSNTMKGKNNPSKRKEVRKKISDAKTGKRQSEEHRRKNKEAQIDKHLSEETKKKISISSTGRKHSEKSKQKMKKIHKGKLNGMYGKHWTDEHVKQLSIQMSGKGNPNWCGGMGKLGYPFNFNKKLKELIRKRDNNTCQLCSVKQKTQKLSVHHINYIKEDINPSNLITLCNSCNIKVNHKRKYWTKFFKLKLKLKLLA